jgi:hypothetical protein
LVGKDYPERWIGGELDIVHDGVLTEVRVLFGAERLGFSLPLCLPWNADRLASKPAPDGCDAEQVQN